MKSGSRCLRTRRVLRLCSVIPDHIRTRVFPRAIFPNDHRTRRTPSHVCKTIQSLLTQDDSTHFYLLVHRPETPDFRPPHFTWSPYGNPLSAATGKRLGRNFSAVSSGG